MTAGIIGGMAPDGVVAMPSGIPVGGGGGAAANSPASALRNRSSSSWICRIDARFLRSGYSQSRPDLGASVGCVGTVETHFAQAPHGVAPSHLLRRVRQLTQARSMRLRFAPEAEPRLAARRAVDDGPVVCLTVDGPGEGPPESDRLRSSSSSIRANERTRVRDGRTPTVPTALADAVDASPRELRDAADREIGIGRRAKQSIAVAGLLRVLMRTSRRVGNAHK